MAAYDGPIEIVRHGQVIASGQAHLETEPAEPSGDSGWRGVIHVLPEYRNRDWRLELITIRLILSGREAQALITRVPGGPPGMVITSAPGAQPFWE